MTSVTQTFETALSTWCNEQKLGGEDDSLVEEIAQTIQNTALAAIELFGEVFTICKCSAKEIDAINLHDTEHVGKHTRLLISAVDGINMQLGEIVLNINAGRDIISCSNTGTISGTWTHSPEQDEETAEEVTALFEQEKLENPGVDDELIGVVCFRAREKVIPHMKKLGVPFKLFMLEENEAKKLKAYGIESVSPRTKLMIDLLGKINARTSSCDIEVNVNWYESGVYLVATWHKAKYGEH